MGQCEDKLQLVTCRSLRNFFEALGESKELTLQEDMSQQFAAILEEIDRKQGQIDFSEVLQALQTTSPGLRSQLCFDMSYSQNL